MTAFSQPTTAEIRQTINTAGTILMSRYGLVYFDLNAKTPPEVDKLRQVLRMLADLSGSTVEEGVPHPLTQSTGTMLLRLNQTPNVPATRAVRDGIFYTGNCYCYESASAPKMAFAQFAMDLDHASIAGFAAGCRLAVPAGQQPNVWGLSETRTLLEDTIHAVALNVKMVNPISSEAFVSTTLYDRDPVKSLVVESYLQTLADRYGDKYERTPMMVGGYTAPVMVHRIEGFGSANELDKRTQNPSIIFLDDVRRAIQRDISNYSTAYNVEVVSQRRDSGSILESLGIQSVPIEDHVLDLDLSTPSPR